MGFRVRVGSRVRVGVAQGARALATALALGALQRVVIVRRGGATPAATGTTPAAATAAAPAVTEGRRPGAARVRDSVGCALAGSGLRLGLGLGLRLGLGLG